MYDITCKLRDDSINFFNMHYNRVLEIIEDFRYGYILEIINTKTRDKYIIINKQSVKDFMKKESKYKEVE